ncbi:glycosyltransferase [Methanobacterium sp.]|uniref:glycosyltransferase family 2 protein n=1 Tax=Methanobacterium sp. TaxID=2164 RepID=UPI00315814A0
MISIICVYNNKEILDECLLNSLENQNELYELILIDNSKIKFKSAAEALNYGGEKAKGEYIMFVHQDVSLCSSTWLNDAEKILKSLKDKAVAGIVGMSDKGVNNGERGKNTLIHGNPPEKWGWGNPIKRSEIVQTLDECLIIIPMYIFEKFKFDEITCPKWDLYVVEYCLNIKSKGLKSYVMPLAVYHKSTGAISKNYFCTLNKVLKKHSYLKQIYTTCGNWNTKYPLFLQKYTFILILQMFLNKLNARKTRMVFKRKFKHES